LGKEKPIEMGVDLWVSKKKGGEVTKTGWGLGQDGPRVHSLQMSA